MLDNNSDIIAFLQNHITLTNLVSNLTWDREKEIEKQCCRKNITLKYRYNLAIKLLNNDLNFSVLPLNIVIYGAGNIGKAFFNKIKGRCFIECFIDANPIESEYKGIPIISLDRMNEVSCNNFIITPSYDIDNIKRWFMLHYQKANLISIEELLH